MSLITVPEIYYGDTLSLLTFLFNKFPGQIVNLIELKIISSVNVMLLQSTNQHMTH